MAKLVTKFKYLKPNPEKGLGGYAKYIATREGVEKIDDSQVYDPATQKQRQLIEKITADYPETKELLEYEDYTMKPTVGYASEFITRAIEVCSDSILDSKTYADYIATRPRAQKFGSHGLFTDDGKPVKISKVSRELNLHDGNVWTVIVSLRRDDAERLGYSSGESWRELLRSMCQDFSNQFHIPLDDLRWYAAFHDEGHHPHVHMIVYSANKSEGFLSQEGVQNLRSAFGRKIFAHDLMTVYREQTTHRDTLRSEGKEYLAEIVAQINDGSYDNPVLEQKLLELSRALSQTKGKKVYGFLDAETKELVNEIVDELAGDERLSQLYDLWYQDKDWIQSTYTDEPAERVPLSQNEAFKPIRNAVIREALNISEERFTVEDEDETAMTENVLPEDDSEDTEIAENDEENVLYSATDSPNQSYGFRYKKDFSSLLKAAKDGNMYAQYGLAKLMRDKDSKHFNPIAAAYWLERSAKQGYTIAKYVLGKILLYGIDVPQDIDRGVNWLQEAVMDDNQFAEYLLGKTYLRGELVERDLEQAEGLLRQSADQGNRFAQYTLGKALLDGDLLEQRIYEAVELLRKSAEQSFPWAQYLYGKLLSKGEVTPKDLPTAIKLIEKAAGKNIPNAAYLAGKLRLTEKEIQDYFLAVLNFEFSAESGNSYAEYQLGKMYLYGKGVEKDTDLALSYLSQSAEHGNPYATQLLYNLSHSKNPFIAMSAFRLLQYLARIIQNRIEDERKGKEGMTDKKLRRIIDVKREAHGLKHG